MQDIINGVDMSLNKSKQGQHEYPRLSKKQLDFYEIKYEDIG